MERLEKIKIKGFKSIRDQELDVMPINMLIGSNGSGKSNFIDAFTFLHEIAQGNLRRYVKIHGGAERLIHFGSKETETIKLKVWFNNSVDQYEIALQPTTTDELVPVDETAYYWKKSTYDNPYRESLLSSGSEAAISSDKIRGVSSYVKSALNSWRVYHFHDTGPSSPMIKVSDVDDNRFLRSDASNLAAFLNLLKEEHEQEYTIIRNTVRRIAPFFDDFVLMPRALDETGIRLEWKHKGTDKYFDVSDFSDGTLRFIALTTLLMQPSKLKPSVILLDEPELGLHPSAITVLGAMIRQASNDVQIIASTQSPFLLDMFEPEEVVIVERDNGESVFTRLSSNELSEWLQEFSLGELWEKNEIGGRPKGGHQ